MQTRKIAGLTPAESKVLDLLSDGKTTLEIGKQLRLDPEMVKSYIICITRKIRTYNNTFSQVSCQKTGR
jgi:DNA-binding CsgD family transcriptional regulator